MVGQLWHHIWVKIFLLVNFHMLIDVMESLNRECGVCIVFFQKIFGQQIVGVSLNRWIVFYKIGRDLILGEEIRILTQYIQNPEYSSYLDKIYEKLYSPDFASNMKGRSLVMELCRLINMDLFIEAINKLNKSGDDTRKLCRNLDRVYDYIANYHGPDGTDKIVDKLKEISIPDVSISFWTAMNLVARINKDIMMRNLRRLGSGKSKSDGFLERERYDLQKTDDFSFSKINEFVRVICENHPRSDQHIRVKSLGKDIVYLTG